MIIKISFPIGAMGEDADRLLEIDCRERLDNWSVTNGFQPDDIKWEIEFFADKASINQSGGVLLASGRVKPKKKAKK